MKRVLIGAMLAAVLVTGVVKGVCDKYKCYGKCNSRYYDCRSECILTTKSTGKERIECYKKCDKERKTCREDCDQFCGE